MMAPFSFRMTDPTSL